MDNVVDLQTGFAGQVLAPDDSGYDECRKVFNAMHDKRPAVIARCATTRDVVKAVNFARDNALLVAIRCGGHSVAGFSICDAGILIDLAGLNTVQVDPQNRTARAGGGVLWGPFDAATQQHALHTPGGRVTTTGLGGFTTGGGYGWTSSKYGLTCDNLISAEVVLADGRVVRASEREHADLFWGIRGGGSNFGIVTEFEFQLHPLGPIVLAGLLIFPADRAEAVIRKWRDYAEECPDELSSGVAMLTAPPEPFVPDDMKGRTVLGMPVMYVGDAAEGAKVVQPLKDLGPAVDLVQPMPYVAFQSMLDPGIPKDYRNYWRGEYLQHLPDDAISTYVERAAALSTTGAPFSQVILFRVGQAVAAVADDATAFSHRDAKYMLHPIILWADGKDDARVIAATREMCEAMRPFTTGGVYLNFTPEERVRDAYGPEKYRRLVAVKDRYDPTNLFRLNQNIKPSAEQALSR